MSRSSHGTSCQAFSHKIQNSTALSNIKTQQMTLSHKKHTTTNKNISFSQINTQEHRVLQQKNISFTVNWNGKIPDNVSYILNPSTSEQHLLSVVCCFLHFLPASCLRMKTADLAETVGLDQPQHTQSCSSAPGFQLRLPEVNCWLFHLEGEVSHL